MEKKLGTVAHLCHPRNGRKYKIGNSWFRLVWAKKQDSISKIMGLKIWFKQ
jgi:hypothetical protein